MNIGDVTVFRQWWFFLTFGVCCLAASLLVSASEASSTLDTQGTDAVKSLAANDPQGKKQVDPLEIYSDWMMGYYKNPNLEKVVPSIQAFAKRGLFERGNYSIHIIVFYGHVFRQHPDKLQKWIMTDLKDFKGDKRVSLMLMLWFANTDKAKAILKTMRQQTVGDERALIDKTMTEQPPDLVTLDLKPDALDMCWSSFAATGDRRYVKRIIDALDPQNYLLPKNTPEDKIKGIKAFNEATRQSAMWSLGSWSEIDKKVLQICQEEAAKRPPDVAALLKKIIQKNTKAPA